MPTLVELLGTYAPGHVLGGLTFGRIDQAAKAALAVDYFRRARETVYAIRDEVTAEDYDRQLRHVLDSYRKGEYALSPGSESFGYFLGPGLPELVARLTGAAPDDVRPLLESHPVEVMHLCLCLVYESLGEPDKKKLRSQEGTPAVRELAELLSSAANGAPATPTSPPASPRPASALSSSPA